jgi:hypothetical protein
MNSTGRFGDRIPGFLFTDLLFFHNPVSAARPAWWRTGAALAVAAVSVGLLLVSRPLAPPSALTWSDGHRNTSLEIALNRVLCRTNSRISPAFPVARYLEAHPESGDMALPAVTVELAGSSVEYCRSTTQPFRNNENSLMLEMAALLRVEPQLSLRQLGWRLQIGRVAALVAFALVVLENGASLAFATALLSLGLGILGYMGSTSYYSVYPFLPVHLVLTVALLSYGLQRQLPLGSVRHGMFSALAGWLVAFAVNMRSSHLPVYLVFLVLYFVAARRMVRSRLQRWPRRAQVGWLLIGLLSTGIGYGLFGFLFVRPLAIDGGGGRAYSYHPVAHALVLGLAVPENALSRREGIEWVDEAGLALAHRVDPRVQYLREGYDQALFIYYWRLWRQHPSEMLQIYRLKLQTSGRTMLAKLASSPIAFFVRPLLWLSDGVGLLALYAVVFWLSVAVHLGLRSPLAFTLALLSVAGALLQLESALVFSNFDLTHYSSQLLCFLAVAALAWQVLLESVRVVARQILRRSARKLSQ